MCGWEQGYYLELTADYVERLAISQAKATPGLTMKQRIKCMQAMRAWMRCHMFKVESQQ